MFFTVNSLMFGQITSSSSSDKNDSKTQQAEKAEQLVKDLTNKSGVLFKEGLTALSDNRRSIAGDYFDKSIEVFLMSGVDVKENQKLRECYNQLIETVYRIEFPADNQLPQIRSLSATCGWDIKNETADNIAKIIRTQPTEHTSDEFASAMTGKAKQDSQPQVGFNEQKFEVSPLDDMAKLTFTENRQRNHYNDNISVRIVRAKAGDSLTNIAQREGISLAELANFNGLLTTSTLPTGREIKILSRERGSIVRRIATESETKEQANCTSLTSPVIQELKLGMTVNEVSKKLNKIIATKKVKDSSPEFYSALISNLRGVKYVYLNFFKGKLFYLKVAYDSSINWNGITEFQTATSKALNLPNTWQGKYSFEKQLICNNFEIEIFNLSSKDYFLTLMDNNVVQAMVSEKLLNEKNKKKSFKP